MHLLETDLPKNKPIVIALRKIFGINDYYAKHICKKLGFSFTFKVYDVTKEQKLQIIKLIEFLKIPINSELKKNKILEKQNLVDLKHYRGLRKLKGFPVRGQRTRSNAKTAKKIK